MKQSFNEIKKTAYNGDKNCCTVISASIVFEKDYEETHAFFKARGRKDDKGLFTDDLEPIYYELAKLEGFTIEKFTRAYKNIDLVVNPLTAWQNEDGSEMIAISKTWQGITLNNFRDYIPKGDYILGVRGHVVGVKDGIIQDWTANVYDSSTRSRKISQRRLDRIYRIEKKDKKVKDLKQSKYDFSKFI